MRIEWRKSTRWLAIGLFVFLVSCPSEVRAASSNICYFKVYPVSKVRCRGSWQYVGPINWAQFGGYCVQAQQNCIRSITAVTAKTCGSGGVYVGATDPSRFGGNCIYPANGWEVVLQQVSSRSTRCPPPSVYLGPHDGSNGGHCVTIKKK